MNTTILLIMAMSISAFNAFVCFRLAKSEQFESAQKVAQCVLIWLVPIAGALIVYAFLREPEASGEFGYVQNKDFIEPVILNHSFGSGDYLSGSGHDSSS